eukprot:TRINITY_DN10668_c0_g1_i1.p1 TRINITY_DN10668_c0_g1~~TRINITY_DN10668_c0_g1_i1.p1  ORF type:complete len:396 (-),score=47.14 TRINITY_DN10668_c0_g1_i1:342-1529(-)
MGNNQFGKMQSADVEGGKGGQVMKKSKREWPLKIRNAFAFIILLAAGVMLGAVGNFHMTGYFGDRAGSFFSSACQVTNIYDFQQSRALYGRGSYILKHNHTDDRLLFLASMEPRRTPPEDLGIVKKVAFLFLVKGSIPFEPIWNRFFKGNQGKFSVYVHASPDYEPVHAKSSFFYGRYIPSQPTGWGEISICDAERRLLANALLDIGNERFVLLSESCLPIFNFTTVYNYLIQSQYSFISVFDDPGQFGRGRYNQAMEPEVFLEQWRKGSQWFDLNRKHALAVIADTKFYAKFREFCVPACYVDEHYMPTMLSILYPGELANRSVTFVDWSRGGYHPATFGEGDINADFLYRIQNDKYCTWNDLPDQTCFLFARKFSPGTLEPIQQLASTVLGIV